MLNAFIIVGMYIWLTYKLREKQSEVAPCPRPNRPTEELSERERRVRIATARRYDPRPLEPTTTGTRHRPLRRECPDPEPGASTR